MLNALLNSSFGTEWKRVIVSGPWSYKDPNGETLLYNYSRGQPMGAYSSWAVFALSHHFMVWLAAYNCGIPIHEALKFYAVVGDDIIIFNDELAAA